MIDHRIKRAIARLERAPDKDMAYREVADLIISAYHQGALSTERTGWWLETAEAAWRVNG